MKIFSFVLISISSVFLMAFIAGMIVNILLNSGRRQYARVIGRMSQVSPELTKVMHVMAVAFKQHDTANVNRIVSSLDSELLEEALQMMKIENRPKSLSSGKLGDTLSFTTMENELLSKGYNKNAATIITGIVLNDYYTVLLNMKG